MIAILDVCTILIFLAILINAYRSRYWFTCLVCSLIVFLNGYWLYTEATTIGLSDRAILSQLYRTYHKASSTVEKNFDNKEEQKQTQEQNSNQKQKAEWECTIVDNQKICTRQENKGREDLPSEWDCVTEGNRKICTRHGEGQQWY